DLEPLPNSALRDIVDKKRAAYLYPEDSVMELQEHEDDLRAQSIERGWMASDILSHRAKPLQAITVLNHRRAIMHAQAAGLPPPEPTLDWT
ncbi:hypothetical protein INO08_15540, partial [Staphylococcus aureus]|nr:hypothetical protein [Staphylococcus aureus]